MAADSERFGWRHALLGVAAATIGTTIEWYDFFLYGMAASLVFNRIFFPTENPYTGTLLALSTFAVGFVTRPIGAVIFGHFGDRLGRKTTLTASLVVTGASTFAIGLVPSYQRIGLSAAAILVALRLIQGLGLGGEWGRSVLISIEWEGFERRRGFFASWPQWGVPAGTLLAAGVLSLINQFADPAAFLAWGWRVPFLLSAILVAFGLWVRLAISETPEFTKLGGQELARTPVLEVIRGNWREVILTCLARAAEQGPFYIFVTFVLVYGTENLKLDRGMLLGYLTLSAVVSMLGMPLWGYLSDVIGRKTMYLIGAVMLVIIAFPYFSLLNTRASAMVGLGIILSVVVHDMMYGPQAAMIAEVFPTRVRYSGASLGFQLSSVIAGGPAPVIASWLFHRYGGSAPISVYLMILGAVSIIATLMLREPVAQTRAARFERSDAIKATLPG